MWLFIRADACPAVGRNANRRAGPIFLGARVGAVVALLPRARLVETTRHYVETAADFAQRQAWLSRGKTYRRAMWRMVEWGLLLRGVEACRAVAKQDSRAKGEAGVVGENNCLTCMLHYWRMAHGAVVGRACT